MGSAKVTLKEIDLSTRVSSFPGLSGGIVMPAKKGPLGVPVLVTSEEQYISIYGEPEPKLGLAHYSALAFLAQSNKLWVVRVANGALYAGAIIGSKDAASVSTTLAAGVIDYDQFVFSDDDKESLLITGANQGVWADKVSVTLEPSSNYKNAYILKVYQDTDAGKELVETFEVSRLNQKDNYGKQMLFEEVINTKSAYIRVKENPANVDAEAKPEGLFIDSLYDFHLYKEPYTLLAGETIKNAENKGTTLGTVVFDQGVYWEYIGATALTEGATIEPSTFTSIDTKASWRAINRNPSPVYLSKGSDGSTITVGNLMKGADKLSNPETINVTLLLDGGFTYHAYHTHLVSIAEKRINTFAFLSVDPDAENTATTYLTEVVNYRRAGLINSSYGALYTPHVKVYDKYNDLYVYASPDGFAAAAMAYTARNFEMWVPPAGWDAGKLNVNGLNVIYSEGERDVLYDNGINPLRQAPNKGIAVWGQKTLQSKPSALDRVNVRMLLIVIEPSIMDFLDYFEFKINDQMPILS